MTEPCNTQTIQPKLEGLSPEEKRSDLYITAIHELERRREKWSISRLEKIAGDLGINQELLRLTWCLIQATNRTRRKPAPGRLGVDKAYARLVGGIQKAGGDGIPEKELDTVRECLLTAGWRGVSARKSVEALLTGRERELRMRESSEFVDVSDSDEEGDDDVVKTLCRRAMGSLPGVEDVSAGKVSAVTRRLAELANGMKAGSAPAGASREARRMARHRRKALEWVARSARPRGRGGDVGRAIDDISEEAGVSVHPRARRVLQDAFDDARWLAGARLTAFRALLPRRFLGVAREREVRRLAGLMKEADRAVAEALVRRFGSAERCLRGHVSEIGEGLVRAVHGFDADFHKAVERRVRNVWMVARVMKDKFGEFETAKDAGFLEVVGGGGETVELTEDERLGFYEGVNAGMERKQFSVVWGLFRWLCEAGVEGCVQVVGRLVTEFGEDGLLKGLLDSDYEMLCCLIGINSDGVLTLRQAARAMLD